LAAREPPDRGPGQIHRVQETPCWWSAGLRAHPWHRRNILHCPAIFGFRPESRKFGEAGLAATIIALIAVLSLVPVFGVLLVRNEKVFAVKFQAPMPASRCCAISATGSQCAWSAGPACSACWR